MLVLAAGVPAATAGTRQDLDNLTPAGSPQIMYANGINDNGQIAADASGAAVLLTPN